MRYENMRPPGLFSIIRIGRLDSLICSDVRLQHLLPPGELYVVYQQAFHS